MTEAELEEWVRAHLTVAQGTRRLLPEFNPILALRRRDGTELIILMVVPKDALSEAIAKAVHETQAVACALALDTWVGRPNEVPAPGQSVRDMPGSVDAMGVFARCASGHQAGALARYADVGGELVFEEPVVSPKVRTKFLEKVRFGDDDAV